MPTLSRTTVASMDYAAFSYVILFSCLFVAGYITGWRHRGGKIARVRDKEYLSWLKMKARRAVRGG